MPSVDPLSPGKTSVEDTFASSFSSHMFSGEAAVQFNRRLSEMFKKEPTKMLSIQKSVGDYCENYILLSLVDSLYQQVSSPDQLKLFLMVKPFVLPNHQMMFHDMSPCENAQQRRVVLRRNTLDNSFGFYVRGGQDFRAALFVSHVENEVEGLSVGDKILSVNDFNCTSASLIDWFQFVRMRNVLTLQVVQSPMLPLKINKDNSVQWVFPEGARALTTSSGVYHVIVQLKRGFGCSMSKRKRDRGIYVERVVPFSVAHDVGLRQGDQLLFVNDVKFYDISKTEAVMAFHRFSPASIYFLSASHNAHNDSILTSLKRKPPEVIMQNLQASSQKFVQLVAKHIGIQIHNHNSFVVSNPIYEESENGSPATLRSHNSKPGHANGDDTDDNQLENHEGDTSWEFESMFSYHSDVSEQSNRANQRVQRKTRRKNKELEGIYDEKSVNKEIKMEQPNSNNNPGNKEGARKCEVESREDDYRPKDEKVEKNAQKPDTENIEMRTEDEQPDKNTEKVETKTSDREESSKHEATSTVSTLRTLSTSAAFRNKLRRSVGVNRSNSFIAPNRVAIESEEAKGLTKVTVLFGGGHLGLSLEGGRLTSSSTTSSVSSFVTPLIVKEVFPESPLMSSVQKGDRVVSLDGVSVEHKHLSEVHSLINKIERSKRPGSSVDLVIEPRHGKQPAKVVEKQTAF